MSKKKKEAAAVAGSGSAAEKEDKGPSHLAVIYYNQKRDMPLYEPVGQKPRRSDVARGAVKTLQPGDSFELPAPVARRLCKLDPLNFMLKSDYEEGEAEKVKARLDAEADKLAKANKAAKGKKIAKARKGPGKQVGDEAEEADLAFLDD